jgi:hypothetical protein
MGNTRSRVNNHEGSIPFTPLLSAQNLTALSAKTAAEVQERCRVVPVFNGHSVLDRSFREFLLAMGKGERSPPPCLCGLAC